MGWLLVGRSVAGRMTVACLLAAFRWEGRKIGLVVYCMYMYCDGRASDVTKACVLPRWQAWQDGRMAGWRDGRWVRSMASSCQRASHWSAVGNRYMYLINMCVSTYVRTYMAFDVMCILLPLAPLTAFAVKQMW